MSPRIQFRGRGWIRIAALLLPVCNAATPAFAAAPEVSYLVPSGGQRGTKLAVTCKGSFTWPLKVHAPGLEVIPGAKSGELEVTIPADLAADRVWIRLFNADGASAALPFLIGGLPEIEEKEPNNHVRNAHAVPPEGVTANGTLLDTDVDGYTVYLNAGQTVVAAVDANTMLGSPMDAILQVVSPQGVVVAENHDDVDLDPRLAYTATQSGTHVVRLFAFSSTPGQRIAFHGGANYIYRLTITTGPFVTHAVPLAVRSDAAATVSLRGWNLPADATAPVVPYGGSLLEPAAEYDPVADFRNTHDVRLGFAYLPKAAGGARVRMAPFNAVAGIAASDEKNPLDLSLPASVTGLLNVERQADHYKFPLKKGESISVTAETRNLFFPLDPKLKLVDPTGAVAFEFDDATPARVSAFVHAAAHDGEYRLAVSDKYRHGGPRSYYRLTVRLEEADFELTAAADAIVVTPDQPAEMAVTILRRVAAGIAIGPITIEAIGLPPGVTAEPVVSQPSGDTAGKVTLVLKSTDTTFSGPIRIVGRATQPKPLERFARTPAKLGNCFESIWLTATAKPAPAK